MTWHEDTAHVLLVDDDRDILSLMRETLEGEGYIVTALDDPLDAGAHLARHIYDAIVTDIQMPHMDGIELLRLIKRHDSEAPVIMITGFADIDNLMTSFRYGAHDYLKKPFSMSELIITVAGAVEKRSLKRQISHYYEQLEQRVVEKTHELLLANRKLEENLLGAILSIVNALEASDIYTRGHSERVTALSLMLGEQMNLPNHTMKTLRLGAVLHDVGKIGVTHDILNKPASLTDDEYDVMKEHPEIGLKIIGPIDLEDEVFHIVSQHHERVNGEGYPNGLEGDAISPLARIVAVADAYDAMTSDRPYRQGMSSQQALAELKKWAGVQFDANVVEAMDAVFARLERTDLGSYNIIKENI